MKYSLGLDIGITSVGWAVLNWDDRRIEDLGVRAFNAAEHPKSGAPLAEPRRMARSIRRRLRRRAGRLSRARSLFAQYGLIPAESMDAALRTDGEAFSPWELRAAGLDRLLTGDEFARALYHIAKRRGFKSNRKKVKESEDGKMLEAIIANRRVMAESGYRTAGEMLCRTLDEAGRVRNTTDSYTNTVDRDMLEEEAKILFERQRALRSPFASVEFEQAFLDVFTWQLPFASADRILKMVGECTFIKGEKRAPRNSYHVERFTLLGKVNSLTYTTGGSKLRLTDEQRAALVEFAYSHLDVKYAQVRKVLGLSEDARFTGLDYIRRKKGEDPCESLDCEKKVVLELKGYHRLKKACEEHGIWDDVKSQPALMDDLAYALTFYKTDEEIGDCLAERGVPQPVIDAALACDTFDKTSNLCITAIKRILPHLEQGLLYSEACEAAGFDHSNPEDHEKSDKLPAIGPDVTNNPVVRRALSQSRKVVNAVIRKYGAPYRIHIELARDLGKSATDRREIQRDQDEGRAENERVKERIRQEFHREPSSEDVRKFRLYSDQLGKCAYSQTPLEIDRLFEPGYVEIDHIVPYSRCFDDSQANKALVLAHWNQNKRNRTPFEFFGHDEKHWAEFEAWARTIRNPRKRNNLLRKEVDEGEWKERSLQDTKYIAREFSSFVRNHLIFAAPTVQVPVVCVNGQMTARVRGMWGLAKNREENDLHHALDAAVVASLVQHQITMITEHSKLIENGEGQLVNTDTGEVVEWEHGKKPRLPMPWQGFRRELLARLSENPVEAIRQLNLTAYEGFTGVHPVIVSRMPQRKVTGAIHEETIRSAKLVDSDRKSAVRKRLTSLSTGDLRNLVCQETDPKLYAEICRRMDEYGGKADKAFAEPMSKPTNDGSPGPIVKSVKVYQPQYSGINVRAGIADNGDMVRVDVSRVQDKKGKWQHYFTPVYVCHVMANELPSVPGEFMFALYSYDLMRFGSSEEPCLAYYRKYNRNTQSLAVCELNNAQALRQSIGVRNLEVLEKYVMDVLGDYYRVVKEVRRGLADSGDIESGEAED